MSAPRTRQPRELLSSINEKLFAAADADDSDWAMSAWSAGTVDVYPRLESAPADPPKRSYYGSRGGLRNPHRA